MSFAREDQEKRLSLNSRTRLITIRLTAGEYDTLRSVCLSEGARSLSDYTRHCILRHMTTNGAAGPSLGDDLKTVSARLTRLRQVIRECNENIEKILGVSQNDTQGS